VSGTIRIVGFGPFSFVPESERSASGLRMGEGADCRFGLGKGLGGEDDMLAVCPEQQRRHDRNAKRQRNRNEQADYTNIRIAKIKRVTGPKLEDSDDEELQGE
jgi:hypothetical protein